MKKFLALLLALVMALSLVACGENSASKNNDDDDDSGSKSASTGATDSTGSSNPTDPSNPTGNITQPTTAPTTTPTIPGNDNFDTGRIDVNARRWENRFVGIYCELGSEWTFLTEEQIRQNNETVIGILGSDYVEALKNAQAFTDMMATHSNATDTIGVSFEKLPTSYTYLTEEQYAQIGKEEAKTAFESMGMQNVTITLGTMTFAGATHACMNISATYYALNVYEKVAIVKCGEYMVLFTAATWNNNGCQEILENFHKL